MTDPVPTAVTYDGLPISSGGAHRLGRMTPRAAYEQTRSFLRTCTEPMRPVHYEFSVRQVPELDPALEVERELERRFGRGSVVILHEDEVDDALDFLDDVHPLPTNQWGMAPLEFRASAKGRLLDPATGHPLPGQTDDLFHRVGFNNQLVLMLGNQASLGIELCLPDADDQLLSRILPWLDGHLPCKLSTKHWRAWRPTRSRTLQARVLDVSPYL